MSAALSIRGRLVLSFSVLLCLLLAVAAVSLQRFQALTDRTSTLIDDEVRQVFLAQRADHHAQAAAICLLNILQTPARDQRVPLYAAMDADNEAVAQAVAALGRNAATPALEHLVALGKTYSESFQETVELIELEGLAPAQRHYAERTAMALGALLGATQKLVARHQEMTQTEVEQLRHETANARLRVILLSLCAFVVGSALAWIIARSIVRPVNEAVSLAQAIASGDYLQAVPEGRQDEIGALLRALATMRDSIASREARILRLAYVDPLTGLPNRTRFLEMFAAVSPASHGALILLDIDRFAPINKALGHAVGDRLLCEVGQRITQAVAASDVVARLWGDEFAVLLRGADAATSATRVKQILASLRAPISLDGQQLDIDASLGIVHFPDDGADLASLLRRADLAMTSAKRRHAGFAFGADIDDTPSHEQLSLLGEMRGALANREFILHYQPKLDLARRRITGTEALIRWRHPVKGMVAPGSFIPFAEQTGFIREITPWLLRQAIEHAAQWMRSGLDLVTSLNLSTLDLLNHALVGEIRKLLDEYRLPPRRICLEITESALMNEPELALKHLNELAELGLKLSIDDYGTGQASLAYVKTLPVHELKIDRAFVSGVDADSRNAAIVRSTLLLCRELGLSVVAEGAETDGEIAWLRRMNCDQVQGYGVAKPMPEADFVAWVRDFNRQS